MRSTKNSGAGAGCEPTSVTSLGEKPKRRKQTRLSQEQLQGWWPFTRLNPSLFPLAQKQTDPLDDVEEAPI